MATAQKKSEKKVETVEHNQAHLAALTDLSARLLDGFLHCASRICGSQITCNPQQVCAVSVESLAREFKKPVCVNSVKAQGLPAGTFHFVLGREALFTLAGVAAGQPKKTISQNSKSGTIRSASQFRDILIQFGEVLVCSWNLCSHDEVAGVSHFERTDTFIGDPWRKPKAGMGLDENEELVCVPYEMQVGAYPAFKCAIIFPKEVLSGAPLPPSTQAGDSTQEPEGHEEPGKKADQKKTDEVPQGLKKEPAHERARKVRKHRKKKAAPRDQEKATTQEKPSLAASDTKPASEPTEGPATESSGSAAEQEAGATGSDTSQDAVAEKQETIEGPQQEKGPVSESISRIVESPATLPGENQTRPPETEPSASSNDRIQTITAEDIMQENILWGDPEQGVQEILAKMQQYKTGYVLIGDAGKAEGITSESNLKEALSPYLHAPFDKWKRPLDDATLRIKVRWVMSEPVHSIEREAPLSAMMARMCEDSLQVLVVTDQENKVQGLVTTFDIFSALLKAGGDTSASK